MRNFTLVAAAVAAVLGTAVAQADQPTLAAVQAAITGGTAAQFWISGSSAAKNGTKAFVAAQLCTGGTLTAFASSTVSNPDFNAWACTGAAGTPNPGVVNVVYYRAEGGSVVGVYPIINNTLINQLDLSAANTTCAGAPPSINCPIAGTALGNGSNDSWGPTGVAKHRSDLGISDLEPDAFVGSNSPYAAAPPAGYASGTFGAQQTQAALKAMNHQTIFQQTFGIVVNTALGSNVSLTKSAIANILNGSYSDWSSVPAFGAASPGAGVTAAATPIFLCNREVGSGTRTSAAIYFLGNHCVSGAAAVADSAGGAISDNYSTADELSCVNTNGTFSGGGTGAIAIGYASVDNASKVGTGTANPNVEFVSINGVAQSNYNSAIGQNDYAFEATAQPNAASGNALATAFTNFIVPKLQAIASAPQSAQVNALPFIGANSAQLPLQANGVIFTTDFVRGGSGPGNSCIGYTEQN